MQVFKLFMKLLERNKGIIILYTMVFLLLSFLVMKTVNGDGVLNYDNVSCKLAVFDNDKSELSNTFINYISNDNKIIKIKDNKETIQDELFNRNVDCVIKIEKGFEEAVLDSTDNNNEINDFIIVNLIPGTMTSSLITGKIDNYMRILSAYIQSGCSIEEAVKLTEKTQKVTASTKLLDKGNVKDYSDLYYFFLYLAYAFVVMMIIVIGHIVGKLNDKEIRNRINCSSYKFFSFNKEIFWGILATGSIIIVMYIIFSYILCGNDLLSVNGGLFIINMCCMMIVALSLAYFISQLVSKDNVLTMVANILGLGMSFLSGIFVQMQFLGDSIIKAAHWLPSYWYAYGCEKIDKFVPGNNLNEITLCFFIEMLFSAAFIVAGIVTAKFKKSCVVK